jgi:hydroxymethylpyrimidine pyrophosphatase-like HAD family hydrolase
MADEVTLTILQQELHALFGDEISTILAPEAYMGCYYLTILHPDANKSSGLKTLSDFLGISLDKFSVFGDNYNDLGMFDLAGTSIAVSNAQEAVKEKAHIVLPHSNDEDAVAKYLQGLNL